MTAVRLTRRAALLGLAATAAATAATAQVRCAAVADAASGARRACRVRADVAPIAAQRCDLWCWAACIEAAFATGGFFVAQERVVERLFGDVTLCATAFGPEIVAAASGSWTDDFGARFQGRARVLADLDFGVANPMALQEASRYLRAGVPLISGALGHATLMTGMSWIETASGAQRLTSIELRDPWPGRPARRLMTREEFYGATFLAAVTVI